MERSISGALDYVRDAWDNLKKGVEASFDDKSGEYIQDAEDVKTFTRNQDGTFSANATTDAGGLINSVIGFGQSISDFVARGFGDIDSTQDLLRGLKYNGNPLTEEQQKGYMQLLNQYNTLSNKKDATLQEMITSNKLRDELNKYTVPDKDFGRFWQSNTDALNYDGKSIKPNEKELIKLMEDSGVKREYGLNEQRHIIQQISKNDAKKQANISATDQFMKSVLADTAKMGLSKNYIANNNPGGRQSTIDEISSDLENAIYGTSLGQNLEACKTYLENHRDLDKGITNLIENKMRGMYTMAMDMLLSNKNSSMDAYIDSIRERGDNPLSIGIDELVAASTTNAGKAIVTTTSGLKGATAGLGFASDMYYTINTLTKAADTGSSFSNSLEDFSNGEIASGIKNLFGGTFDAIGTVSSGLGMGLSGLEGLAFAIPTTTIKYSQSLMNGIDSGEFSIDDAMAYMYGWQSSSIFNMKEKTQNRFANTDYVGHDVMSFLYDYASYADDIAANIIEVALLSFGGGGVAATDALAVTVKGASTVSKVETAVSTGNKILKTTESLKEASGIKSFFSGVKDYAVNKFKDNFVQPKVDFFKSLNKFGSSKVIAKEFGSWIAEEYLTSAALQGLVPYEYTSTDLAFDIGGAVFSGFNRTLDFINKTGIVKATTKNTHVWTAWWLREVKGLDDSATRITMSKLSDSDLDSIGSNIQNVLKLVTDSDYVLSKEQFKGKASKISGASRDAINNMTNKIVEAADQKIMKQIYEFKDGKYRSFIKKTEGMYSRNGNALDMQPKIDKIRKEIETFKMKEERTHPVDKMRNIQKTINKNLALYASNDSMYKKYVSKKGNKRTFIKGVSSDLKKEISDFIFKKELQRNGLDRSEYLKNSVDTFSRFKIGPVDETKGGPILQKIKYFINSVIIKKGLKKEDLMRSLNLMGAGIGPCFKNWLRQHYGLDYKVLEYTDFINKLTEFGTLFDEVIFPEFKETSYLVGKEDFGLASKTYKEACSENADLVYLGVDPFLDIVGLKSLDGYDKDTILKDYKRTQCFSKGHVSGLVKKDGRLSTGKVFNNAGEEALILGHSGYLYIRSEPNKYDFHKPMDRTANNVSEVKYVLMEEGANYNIYQVYNDNGNLTLMYVSSDGEILFDRFPSSILDITGDGEKFGFDIVKRASYKNPDILSPGYFGLEEYDTNEVITNLTSKTWKKKKERSITKQWNDMLEFVKKGKTSYREFLNTIPGYTEKISKNFFLNVMNLGDDYKLKQRILMAALSNNGIKFEKTSLRINMKYGSLFYFQKTESELYRKCFTSGIAEVDSTKGGHRIFNYKRNEQKQAFDLMRDDGNVVGEIKFGDKKVSGFYKDSGNVEVIDKEILIHDGTPDKNLPIAKTKDPEISEEELRARETLTKYSKKRAEGTPLTEKELQEENEARETIKRCEELRWNKYAVSKKQNEEMVKKIYEGIYGREMDEATKFKIGWKYAAVVYRDEIFKIYNNQFGRYMFDFPYDLEGVRDLDKTLNKIREVNNVIYTCETYAKKFKDTNFTDKELVELSKEVLYKFNGKLTDGQLETARILGIDTKSFSNYDLMNVLGFDKYGITPYKLESDIDKRLMRRRQTVMAYLLKGVDLSNLTDKEMRDYLNNNAYFRGFMKVSNEELLLNMLSNPGNYIDRIGFLSDIIKKEEDAFNIEQLNGSLLKLEKEKLEVTDALIGTEYKRTVTKDTIAYRTGFNEERLRITKQAIKNLENSIEKAANNIKLVDKVPELKQVLESFKNYQSKIEILFDNEMKRINKEYVNTDTFEKIINERLRGSNDFSITVNSEELNNVIESIKERIPNKDIFVLKEDGTYYSRNLSEKEMETLNTFLLNLQKGKFRPEDYEKLTKIGISGYTFDELGNVKRSNIRGASVGGEDIIIGRENNVVTLGHEWFHNVIAGVFTEDEIKRIGTIKENAYLKHKAEIELNAKNRGYTQGDMTIEQYQDLITEEWLADRFGEYVASRIDLADNDILQFFKELWERVKVILNDKDVEDLFNDIYEGRINYGSAVGTKEGLFYSLPSPNSRKFFDRQLPEWFNAGDLFSENTIESLLNVGLTIEDIALGTDSSTALKGNFYTSIPVAKEDGTYTSFYKEYDSLEKRIYGNSALDSFSGFEYSIRNGISDKTLNDFYWDENGVARVYYDDNNDLLFKLKKEGNNYVPSAYINFGGEAGNYEVITTGVRDKLTKEEAFNFMKDYMLSLCGDTSVRDNRIFETLNKNRIKIYNDLYAKFKNNKLPLYVDISNYEKEISDMMDVFNKGIQSIKTKIDVDLNIDNNVAEIVDYAYKTYLYNTMLPHTMDNTLLAKMYDIGSNIKFENTAKINALSKGVPGVSTYFYEDLGGLPAFALVFNVGGEERKITYHLGKKGDRTKFEEIYAKYSGDPIKLVSNNTKIAELSKGTAWLESPLSIKTLTKDSKTQGKSMFMKYRDWAINKQISGVPNGMIVFEDELGKRYLSKRSFNYIEDAERFIGGEDVKGLNNELGFPISFISNKTNPQYIDECWGVETTKEHADQLLKLLKKKDAYIYKNKTIKGGFPIIIKEELEEPVTLPSGIKSLIPDGEPIKKVNYSKAPEYLLDKDKYDMFVIGNDKIPLFAEKDGSGFVITRGVGLDAIDSILEKRIGFSSSSAIGTKNVWQWGDITLVGRKQNISGDNRALYGRANIANEDSWTPTNKDIFGGIFGLLIADKTKEIMQREGDFNLGYREFAAKHREELGDFISSLLREDLLNKDLKVSDILDDWNEITGNDYEKLLKAVFEGENVLGNFIAPFRDYFPDLNYDKLWEINNNSNKLYSESVYNDYLKFRTGGVVKKSGDYNSAKSFNLKHYDPSFGQGEDVVIKKALELFEGANKYNVTHILSLFKIVDKGDDTVRGYYNLNNVKNNIKAKLIEEKEFIRNFYDTIKRVGYGGPRRVADSINNYGDIYKYPKTLTDFLTIPFVSYLVKNNSLDTKYVNYINDKDALIKRIKKGQERLAPLGDNLIDQYLAIAKASYGFKEFEIFGFDKLCALFEKTKLNKNELLKRYNKEGLSFINSIDLDNITDGFNYNSYIIDLKNKEKLTKAQKELVGIYDSISSIGETIRTSPAFTVGYNKIYNNDIEDIDGLIEFLSGNTSTYHELFSRDFNIDDYKYIVCYSNENFNYVRDLLQEKGYNPYVIQDTLTADEIDDIVKQHANDGAMGIILTSDTGSGGRKLNKNFIEEQTKTKYSLSSNNSKLFDIGNSLGLIGDVSYLTRDTLNKYRMEARQFEANNSKLYDLRKLNKKGKPKINNYVGPSKKIELRKKINDINKKEDLLRKEIEKRNNIKYNFEKTDLYKYGKKIRDTILLDKDAVRDAFRNYKNISFENELVYNVKELPVKTNERVSYSPVGKLIEGVKVTDEKFLKGLESSLPFGSEKSIVTKYGDWEIIPYNNNNLYDENYINKFVNKDNYVIRASDPYTMLSLEADLLNKDPYHEVVYRRNDGNVVYYSRKPNTENIDNEVDDMFSVGSSMIDLTTICNI